MNHEQIVKQSKQAYKQWSAQWRDHAKQHSGVKQKSFEDFRNSGIGRAILCVANGYSFEEHIETIKKYQYNVDIICCDKTLGHLLDNGITPKFCLVCDANVSYEKYLKPWENKLSKTILLQNVCGNPQWTFNGNWKDIYLYVNKDVMQYEREFMALSGCQNVVTAGTNVSNMMVVLLTQSDNDKKQNLFSYDKILLIGYDYSWKFDGKYYAFDHEANGKMFYMRHQYGVSMSGKIIFTSNNLSSSSSWLKLYVDAYRIPVVQCSPDALQIFGRNGDLEEQMQYRHRVQDRDKVRQLLLERQSLEQRLLKANNTLKSIARDHWFAANQV